MQRAVVPVLDLNGFKIANPVMLARIPEYDLVALRRGHGNGPRGRAGEHFWRRRTSWSCGCAASTRITIDHAHRSARGTPDREEGATAELACNEALPISVIKGLKQLVRRWQATSASSGSTVCCSPKRWTRR